MMRTRLKTIDPLSVPASELKAKCSQVLDQVQQGRRTILITRHGRVIARISPVEATERRPIFGFARGIITIRGDIVGPLDVAWEADQ